MKHVLRPVIAHNSAVSVCAACVASIRPAPEVRGKCMRDFVAGLDTLPPVEKGAVLALVDSATLRRIDESGPLEWLSFEVNLELTHAVTARWLRSVVWSFASVLDKVNAAGG